MADKVGMPKVIVKKETYSLSTILGILFITLKLCHVIDWPWLWVLCPFWIPAVLVLGFIGFVIGIMFLGILGTFIVAVIEDRKKK